MQTSHRNWLTTSELLPHQLPAVEKAKRSKVAALFMDMGTGKTRCAIELAALRQSRIKRVIVLCPVSLKATWRAELAKHTDCRAVYVFDDNTVAGEVPEAAWLVCGLESVGQSDRVYLALASVVDSGTMLVVDESHKIKGHRASRTQRVIRLGEACQYRLILTGTPMTQGYEDLYTQMTFLSPKILGYHSWYAFAANHLEYSDKYKGLVVRAHNTAWLAAKMQPYVYQVTKEEAGLNLPAKLFNSYWFDMSQAQADAYAAAKYHLFDMLLADDIDSYAIFELFGTLQKIVSGLDTDFGKDLPNPRLDMLLDVVADIPANEKVIIWTKYSFSVSAIVAALGDCAEYHGDLNEKEREAQLQAWRTSKRFLVATQQSGGHGLTLNESAYAVFYENEFKYAHRIQAEDRNHRIGQSRRPTYIDIVCDCGIDRRINDALRNKGNAAAWFRQEIDAFVKIDAKSRRERVKKLDSEL